MGKNERALLPKDKSGRGVSCKATDLCYFTEREFSEFDTKLQLKQDIIQERAVML